MHASTQKLYRISIETTLEAEDALIEKLTGMFGVVPSSFSLDESKNCVISVYIDNLEIGIKGLSPSDHSVVDSARFISKGSSRGSVLSLIIKVKRQLAKVLNAIQASGLDIGPGTISIRSLRPQDWAESWKRHFKPLDIDGTLLIKPSWSKAVPRDGQFLLVLDPGLSFGTGQHPTTAFCLEQLVAAQRNIKTGAFLDIGTGSGILAIAAAKLGFDPVIAFDNDQDAVTKAIENARINGATKSISFYCKDLLKWTPPKNRFDLVCANLQSDLLIQEARRIAGLLRNHGRLVLAGILESQFKHVQKTYSYAGLNLLETRTVGEWKSGVFC